MRLISASMEENKIEEKREREREREEKLKPPTAG